MRRIRNLLLHLLKIWKNKYFQILNFIKGMFLKPFLIKIDDLISLQSVGHIKGLQTLIRRLFDEFMEYLEEVYIHKL